MTTKTMNEQMEEIEKARDETPIGYDIMQSYNSGRKDQLQTDMKIVEELKEKLKEYIDRLDTCYSLCIKEHIDKLFKESVGR